MSEMYKYWLANNNNTAWCPINFLENQTAEVVVGLITTNKGLVGQVIGLYEYDGKDDVVVTPLEEWRYLFE